MSENKDLFGRLVAIRRVVDDQDVEETVRVRAVKVKDADEYLANVGKEEKLIALATGRDDDWIGSLLSESFQVLADATHEINTLPLHAARQRRFERLDAVMPGTKDRMTQALMDLRSRLTRTLSPESLSSAGPALTPSESGPIPISIHSLPPSQPSVAPDNSTPTTPP